jgi:hypothetical protein
MKISILLKREPFEKIFTNTLELFLNDVYNKEFKVNWIYSRSLINNINDDKYWICNSHINSIFVKNVNNDVFKNINAEYGYNPHKVWNSIFQYLYIKLSQSKFFSHFFATSFISIEPRLENSVNKLIIGGNNKIRVLDIKNNEVYVILKKGFDRSYMKNEVYVRRKFPFLKTTDILKYNNSSFWYIEELVNGFPLDRINDKKNFSNKILNNIRELHFKTSKLYSLKNYLNKIKHKLYFKLNRLSKNDNFPNNRIKKIISDLMGLLKNYDLEIILSFSHGDFHKSNFICNKSDFWIIDWENSGYKQIGYDVFIFMIGSRINLGFANNCIKLFEDSSSHQFIIKNWPELFKNFKIKKEYFITFLIEDFLFYLNEIQNSILFKDYSILEKRCNEYEMILQYFKKQTLK